MNKRLKIFAVMFQLAVFVSGATTLDECLTAAEQNYPLVKQYGLIGQTADLTVENIGKGWLPQITASAKASIQNRVVTLPDALTSMMVADYKGLRKDQYSVGVDITQTVYDGGAIESGKEAARRQAEAETAQNDVDLYAVSQRVNELYFGVLLVDEKIRLSDDYVALLQSNEKKLESMSRRGTASESDYLGVKAERIGVEQQRGELVSQRRQLLRLLSAFCGKEIAEVTMPAEPALTGENFRPELRLIDSRMRLLEANERQLDAAVRPRLSVFASGYYGYPSLDAYRDMFSHNWTLNGMIGAKLTWNISAFYTRKNDKAKLNLQRQALENSRDVFLFNNNLEQISQDENVARYDDMLKTDKEIVSLRGSVRKAAESKLAHGIIDVNDLLRDINSENAAKVQLSTHQIERLKQLWDKKITTNN